MDILSDYGIMYIVHHGLRKQFKLYTKKNGELENVTGSSTGQADTEAIPTHSSNQSQENEIRNEAGRGDNVRSDGLLESTNIVLGNKLKTCPRGGLVDVCDAATN